MHYGCNGIEEGQNIYNKSKSELYSDEAKITKSVQDSKILYKHEQPKDRKKSIKKELNELLIKQTTIKQQIENKRISKDKYKRLLTEQSNIEQQRKLLMKEYKKILNDDIEVPKRLVEYPRKQNKITKRTANIQLMRKAYNTNINEIEKKVNILVTQRKVKVI